MRLRARVLLLPRGRLSGTRRDEDGRVPLREMNKGSSVASETPPDGLNRGALPETRAIAPATKKSMQTRREKRYDNFIPRKNPTDRDSNPENNEHDGWILFYLTALYICRTVDKSLASSAYTGHARVPVIPFPERACEYRIIERANVPLTFERVYAEDKCLHFSTADARATQKVQ